MVSANACGDACGAASSKDALAGQSPSRVRFFTIAENPARCEGYSSQRSSSCSQCPLTISSGSSSRSITARARSSSSYDPA
jgi:hypothetical protein